MNAQCCEFNQEQTSTVKRNAMIVEKNAVAMKKNFSIDCKAFRKWEP